ncbi:hypothetical protein [Paraburkholderia heleia]|uniref:hypothetical protein n=1 Tax=Paraburkholderia heleia TaxID=634127 RepID=UPI002AB746DD|nr:hypothetical protein [Paraburkholderia heleia]
MNRRKAYLTILAPVSLALFGTSQAWAIVEGEFVDEPIEMQSHLVEESVEMPVTHLSAETSVATTAPVREGTTSTSQSAGLETTAGSIDSTAELASAKAAATAPPALEAGSVDAAAGPAVSGMALESANAATGALVKSSGVASQEAAATDLHLADADSSAFQANSATIRTRLGGATPQRKVDTRSDVTELSKAQNADTSIGLANVAPGANADATQLRSASVKATAVGSDVTGIESNGTGSSVPETRFVDEVSTTHPRRSGAAYVGDDSTFTHKVYGNVIRSFDNNSYMSVEGTPHQPYFTAEFHPDIWIMHSTKKYASSSNGSVEEIPYHASAVTAEQYARVSTRKGFYGTLPDTIVRTGVVNPDTLASIANANGDELKARFLETANGKHTQYIANDFGMTITAVRVVTKKGLYPDIHVSVTSKPNGADANVTRSAFRQLHTSR